MNPVVTLFLGTLCGGLSMPGAHAQIPALPNFQLPREAQDTLSPTRFQPRFRIGSYAQQFAPISGVGTSVATELVGTFEFDGLRNERASLRNRFQWMQTRVAAGLLLNHDTQSVEMGSFDAEIRIFEIRGEEEPGQGAVSGRFGFGDLQLRYLPAAGRLFTAQAWALMVEGALDFRRLGAVGTLLTAALSGFTAPNSVAIPAEVRSTPLGVGIMAMQGHIDIRFPSASGMHRFVLTPVRGQVNWTTNYLLAETSVEFASEHLDARHPRVVRSRIFANAGVQYMSIEAFGDGATSPARQTWIFQIAAGGTLPL